MMSPKKSLTNAMSGWSTSFSMTDMALCSAVIRGSRFGKIATATR